MTRIAFATVMLAASVASADGHLSHQGGRVFRGELHVHVWSPDRKPLKDATVGFWAAGDTDPQRLAGTGAVEPPENELRVAKAADLRSHTTAHTDGLVTRYKARAPFWRIGPGTYTVRVGTVPYRGEPYAGWSDPIVVTFTAKEMTWDVDVTMDPKTNKLVGKPLTAGSK